MNRRFGIVFITIFLALVASILPMPEAWRPLRIQWAALVLIYWTMAIPAQVGVGIWFLTGLAEDILTGTLLGQHALGFSVVGFITLKSHRRVRVFPLWQQAVLVTGLLLVERLFFFWVDGTIGRPAKTPESWLAPFLGGLVWPWLFIVMRDLRRRFRVS